MAQYSKLQVSICNPASNLLLGLKVSVTNGEVGPSVIVVDKETEVRIIRQQSVRVATEGETVFCYQNIDNPKLVEKTYFWNDVFHF